MYSLSLLALGRSKLMSLDTYLENKIVMGMNIIKSRLSLRGYIPLMEIVNTRITGIPT
jgi:hypothetical protein